MSVSKVVPAAPPSSPLSTNTARHPNRSITRAIRSGADGRAECGSPNVQRIRAYPVFARHGANQEQIRDVGARYEQHDGDGAQQHPQRGACRRSDEAIQHGVHDRAVLLDDPRVVERPAEACRQFLRESRELGGELFACDPRFMRATTGAPNCPVRTSAGLYFLRPPRAASPSLGEVGDRRHDADHPAHLAGDGIRLSYYRGIAAEPGAPEPVAYDRDPIRVLRIPAARPICGRIPSVA